ncbi:MAG TPA: M23 family metallopeptidase [Actinomycetota bacterium]|jgi:murein DD-endopeptidase MepM/ murein hydrolase activator NlpD|nr:M23 family metallopeptidase [Actinomycetota bacterium]
MRRLSCVLAVLLLAAPPATADDGYLEPVAAEGMVFPVLRSSWYSVINFKNDWHAPRMRLVDGEWVQIGVHEGNDILAEPGTPVVAVAPGRVEQLGWLFYSGWRVGIRGEDGRYWFYAHLRRFAGGLSVGDRVAAGQPLGEVGNTGYGARPGHAGEFVAHLHLGIRDARGTWVNPYPLMRRLYRVAAARR